MTSNREDNRAAIVCSHIAKGGLPVLLAVRTEPSEPEDSGWQFLCNSGKEETESEAQVWLVSEVLDLEPGLAAFINLPVGTRLLRTNLNSKWTKTVMSEQP